MFSAMHRSFVIARAAHPWQFTMHVIASETKWSVAIHRKKTFCEFCNAKLGEQGLPCDDCFAGITNGQTRNDHGLLSLRAVVRRRGNLRFDCFVSTTGKQTRNDEYL